MVTGRERGCRRSSGGSDAKVARDGGIHALYMCGALDIMIDVAPVTAADKTRASIELNHLKLDTLRCGEPNQGGRWALGSSRSWCRQWHHEERRRERAGVLAHVCAHGSSKVNVVRAGSAGAVEAMDAHATREARGCNGGVRAHASHCSSIAFAPIPSMGRRTEWNGLTCIPSRKVYFDVFDRRLTGKGRRA